MPKLKSHRGAAKRFKVTATGKVKVKGSGTRHNLSKKSRKTKRKKGKLTLLNKTDAKLVKRLVPNL